MRPPGRGCDPQGGDATPRRGCDPLEGDATPWKRMRPPGRGCDPLEGMRPPRMLAQGKGEEMRAAVLRFGEWMKTIEKKVKTWPQNIPEILVFIIYTIGHFVMSYYHEPWYDEAVAWQIAKCASVKEILWEIPHYEGHPQFWHILMSFFAKNGVPYQLSLSILSYLFAGTAILCILKYSPFPRGVKLLLPFNYFLFYQYSVISRPYAVMLLAFVLLAMTYKKRNESPVRFVLCLAFLCVSSAYGIVVAGGITIAWVIDILEEESGKKFFQKMIQDRRVWCMVGLLVLAMALIVCIFPAEDNFATEFIGRLKHPMSYGERLLYMLVALPAELFFTAAFHSHGLLLIAVEFEGIEIAMAYVLGAVIWCAILTMAFCRKTLPQLVIPFGLFALFGSAVYVAQHHIGVGMLILIYWYWITLEENQPRNQKKRNYSGILKKFADSVKEEEKVFQGIGLLLLVSMVLLPVVWTVQSCKMEVEQTYAAGRNEALFIKEHHLDKYDIWASWKKMKLPGEKEDTKNVMNTNEFPTVDNVLAYFDSNIFENVRCRVRATDYSSHKMATEEENQINYEMWRKLGKPDVLYQDVQLDLLYGDKDIIKREYTLVYSELCYSIWKGTGEAVTSNIYVRKELAKKLGLKEVEEANLWSKR